MDNSGNCGEEEGMRGINGNGKHTIKIIFLKDIKMHSS